MGMRFAGVRELKNRASELLRRAAAGEKVLITSNGKPLAMLLGLSEDDLEDFVLVHHPDLRRELAEAYREYKANGGVSLSEMRRRTARRRARA